MSWTDERVETLKKLWIEGLSASQIATSLGEVTRNAVIGKIHRLGLSGRARTGVAQPVRKVKPQVAQPIRRVVRPATASIGNAALQLEPAYAMAVETAPQPMATVVPMNERVTIMMLTEQTCRWPMGDPGSEAFSFCGKRSDNGIPYCNAHARIAYQPVERRRDRRNNTDH